MSLVSLFKGRSGASGFGYASTATEVTEGIDLRGKTVLVTGVNSGLGEETAAVLSKRGARVVALARSEEKAREATRGFGGDVLPVACELSDPASVRAAVATVRRGAPSLDVILCNAGIMALPKREILHGQELQFLTNHLGHFILVTGLLDTLADHGRIVMLSSGAHAAAPKIGIQFDDLTFEKNYDPWRSYGQSKLANLLFARSLARKLAGTTKTANAVHPGVIGTNLVRHMNPLMRVAMPIASAIAMKSIPQGAATQCFVATHPSLATTRGEYFADCNVAKSTRVSRDPAIADRLWSVSESIVAAL